MEITANGDYQELTCQPSRIDIFSKDNIDECKRYVLSIQRRLDKAVANGDKPNTKWHLHTLIKSGAVKVLAVHRVCRTNQGRHTAGVDGIAIPKDRIQATMMMENLLEEIDTTKKPDAIRRVYIPKPNGDTRPLGIPTIADRINQDIIRQSIEPICEFHFANCSYGFRPKRSCQDAMADLFNKLGRNFSRKWIVEGDVRKCFAMIKHDHIISTLEEWNISEGIRNVIEGMLKASILEEGITTPNEIGTPQGGIISPLLANVALTHFDNTMRRTLNRNGYKMNIMVRYADDFIIVAKNEKEAETIKEHTKKYLLENVGLELSDAKTHITEISEGFDFLGFNFRKYNDTLLIKPSITNIQNLKAKLSDTVKKANTANEIIAKINPVLIGWGNYYRHAVTNEAFKEIEHFVWHTIWLWTKKKHPNKGRKYRVNKYFAKGGKPKWQFHDVETKTAIFMISSIPIRRFIKIKQDKRVYDVNAIEYWRRREYMNTKNSIITEKSLMALFTKERGRCALCKQDITEDDIRGSNAHKHHMKPRSEGGTWKLSNLRLLHNECHIQLHGMYSRKEMADLIDKGIDYLRLMK